MKYKVSEITVAKSLDKLAKESQETPRNHVGYYLLEKAGCNWKRNSRIIGESKTVLSGLLCFHKNHSTLSYLGSIFLITVLPFFLFLWAGQRILAGYSLGVYLLISFIALILINGMAVYTVNRVFCSILPASFLPKLDFSNGIPEENKTVVVIPAIFSSSDKVAELLEQLEIHYLCNQEKNLYFALLGDFADAQEERMPDDQAIVFAGIDGVRKLNAKYGDVFCFFHRARKWNGQEKAWMGWERKRGKLIEFNRLLLTTVRPVISFKPEIWSSSEMCSMSLPWMPIRSYRGIPPES
jgi:hypothetical protein